MADGDLLTPGEVTVTRWAQTGKLPSIKTPGGHRRFPKADVQRLIDGSK